MHYCPTCRFEVKQRAFKRHTLSITHRKSKLIRAMLERNCMTQADIARRIGLTRERVRQIALQMGFADGRSRHAICRIERRKKALPEFFVEAQKRGFPVEPLGRRSAFVNGKICVQRQACWHRIGKGKYKYTYLSVHRPTSRFDVCAWKLPDGRFLILPEKLVGFKQTSFSLRESEWRGTDSSSHYYREYVERWSQLGKPRRAR